MAQSVMLACVEKRFGDIKTLQPVEWLSDNGSCYTAKETITFAAALGIVSKFTQTRSPQGNGMAEALIKTFKRDYVFCNDQSDAETVIAQLPGWFEDYNENAPHKALGCPRLTSLSVHCKTWSVRFSRGNSTGPVNLLR